MPWLKPNSLEFNTHYNYGLVLKAECALLFSKYNAFKKKERLGLLSNDEANKERNTIVYSLLELIGELKKKLK